MKRTLAITAALLALPGCISFGEKPPEALLTLAPTSQTASATTLSAGPGEAITVLTPTVPAALATNRVPVRSSATELAYVKDAQWVDVPNRMFQQLVSETIQARTGRAVLSPRQFSFDPGLRITGELREFGIDATALQAVVIFDAVLLRGQQVQKRRFEARVPLSEIKPVPVGSALNEAANQVAAQVSDWVK
jgi:cholesterol transport system auxiliary component